MAQAFRLCGRLCFAGLGSAGDFSAQSEHWPRMLSLGWYNDRAQVRVSGDVSRSVWFVVEDLATTTSSQSDHSTSKSGGFLAPLIH